MGYETKVILKSIAQNIRAKGKVYLSEEAIKILNELYDDVKELAESDGVTLKPFNEQ